MSDKAQPWPYKAANARDRTAELAQLADAQLGPLVDEDRIFSATEVFRRASRAKSAIQIILRLMEREGAKTRPE